MDTAFADGIVDQNGVQYQPKINGYSGFESELRDGAKNSTKQAFAIYSRYFAPIGDKYVNTTPTYTITSETQVGTLTILTYVPRKLMIHLDATAYSSVN